MSDDNSFHELMACFCIGMADSPQDVRERLPVASWITADEARAADLYVEAEMASILAEWPVAYQTKH